MSRQCLIVSWQCHGSVMTVSWQCHGSVMAVSWQCHGSVMALPQGKRKSPKTITNTRLEPTRAIVSDNPAVL